MKRSDDVPCFEFPQTSFSHREVRLQYQGIELLMDVSLSPSFPGAYYRRWLRLSTMCRHAVSPPSSSSSSFYLSFCSQPSALCWPKCLGTILTSWQWDFLLFFFFKSSKVGLLSAWSTLIFSLFFILFSLCFIWNFFTTVSSSGQAKTSAFFFWTNWTHDSSLCKSPAVDHCVADVPPRHRRALGWSLGSSETCLWLCGGGPVLLQHGCYSVLDITNMAAALLPRPYRGKSLCCCSEEISLYQDAGSLFVFCFCLWRVLHLVPSAEEAELWRWSMDILIGCLFLLVTGAF